MSFKPYPIQFRVKERIDRPGYGVHIINIAPPSRGGIALLKPVHLEWEVFENSEAVYFSDKEPSFFLSNEMLMKGQFVESLIHGLVEAGLRQDDSYVVGELDVRREMLKREQDRGDRTFSLLERVLFQRPAEASNL